MGNRICNQICNQMCVRLIPVEKVRHNWKIIIIIRMTVRNLVSFLAAATTGSLLTGSLFNDLDDAATEHFELLILQAKTRHSARSM